MLYCTSGTQVEVACILLMFWQLKWSIKGLFLSLNHTSYNFFATLHLKSLTDYLSRQGRVYTGLTAHLHPLNICFTALCFVLSFTFQLGVVRHCLQKKLASTIRMALYWGVVVAESSNSDLQINMIPGSCCVILILYSTIINSRIKREGFHCCILKQWLHLVFSP